MVEGSDPGAGTCTLCGRAVADSPVVGTDGAAFCSTGCRRVHETLGAGTDPREGDGRDGPDVGPGEARPASAQERTFLRVDGIHSTTARRSWRGARRRSRASLRPRRAT
jgi:hypothetical protein